MSCDLFALDLVFSNAILVHSHSRQYRKGPRMNFFSAIRNNAHRDFLPSVHTLWQITGLVHTVSYFHIHHIVLTQVLDLSFVHK